MNELIAHARTIKIGHIVYNEKRGILISHLAGWWTLESDTVEPESFATPLSPELSEAIFGKVIEIDFRDVQDWKVLRSMAQIMHNPVLMSQYNYFMLIDLVQKMNTKSRFL